LQEPLIPSLATVNCRRLRFRSKEARNKVRVASAVGNKADVVEDHRLVGVLEEVAVKTR